jgi:thiamine biosynthesis lipoprotein
MTTEHERRADLFGSQVRILVGPAASSATTSPELAALSAEMLLRNHHRLFTRFDPDSELSRLNAAEATTVPASPTMLAFLDAARWAFARSEGLVDATMIDAVEAGGYRDSLEVKPVADELTAAIVAAPGRRPALPRESPSWEKIELDVAAGTVTRPRGVRFDSGGITKGQAADAAAAMLTAFSSFAVDCGGDLRIGGTDGAPRRVEVADPFTGGVDSTFELSSGAVATSGIGRRLWAADGSFAHHLIDPGRGVPAWTGLVQATAVAPRALDAEVLAKAALLAGPAGASRWLERWGGVVFNDAGDRIVFGPLIDELAPSGALEAA